MPAQSEKKDTLLDGSFQEEPTPNPSTGGEKGQPGAQSADVAESNAQGETAPVVPSAVA